jgi:ferritin-like metal-binding protein YciE
MSTHRSLVDVYAAELSELHGAEVLLGQALPSVVDAAADPQLREILTDIAAQTRRHAEGLGRILQRLGREVDQTESAAMAALVEGVHDAIADAPNSRVLAPADMRIRDAALIAWWRKIEHYRIAAYACVCAFAEVGDDDEDTELLRDSLREARKEDDDLADLADSIINVQAPW